METYIFSTKTPLSPCSNVLVTGNHDLNGQTIEIPEKCIIHFEKDSRMFNGILRLNDTQFSGTKHCISTLIEGNQYEIDTDYFDFSGTNKSCLMQSIVNTANVIQLHGTYIDVFQKINIGKKQTSLIGNGSRIINSFTEPAIIITTNDFIKIVDINFQIDSGPAIYKNVSPTTVTKLSFMIDRCQFVSSGNDSSSIIELLGSREGNITNCFFEGIGKNGTVGINRTDAVNTNIIGCMFSNLSYGIKAIGIKTSSDRESEEYSVYACGLNVQSAVMLGCKYGIYIEGTDSFFLNNSMIDFCDNPLVLISQDGANVTNNYFSTSTVYNDYAATISILNNTNKTVANRNKRIIIMNNTIYGHRSINNYGIEMDIESKDCTIQGNTIDYFTNCGIFLRHNVSQWSTEKLTIDNNRFYLNFENLIGIGGCSGSPSILISNNYAIEGVNTSLVHFGNSRFGEYLYSSNHDYLAGGEPVEDIDRKVYYLSRRNNTRFKLNLTFTSEDNSMTIQNPLGDSRIVVYIANNRYPICVHSITTDEIRFTKSVNVAMSFTAVIEHQLQL